MLKKRGNNEEIEGNIMELKERYFGSIRIYYKKVSI